MSLQWGSEYRLDEQTLLLPLGEGRSIRKEIEASGSSPANPVRRMRTLAAGQGGQPASYFDVLCVPPGPSAERSSLLS